MLTVLAICSPMAVAAVNPLETTMVLVNQIGYDLRDTKTFLVQSPVKDLAITRFTIKDTTGGKTVFKGKLQPLGTVKSWEGNWAQVHYWKGDFSNFKKSGRYVIEVGDSTPVVSPAFSIGREAVFKDIAPFSGLAFLKLDRYANGGWKSDGVPGEDNVLFCVAACALGLAKVYEADTSFWKEQGKADAMLEEIRWGLKGLQFAQEQEKNGRFVGTNPDGRNDTFAGLGIAALAHLAKATYLSPEERADCLRRAKMSWEYYKDKDKLIAAFGMQPDGPHYAPLAHSAMVLGSTELYETEKDQRYLDAAAHNATMACRFWNRTWPNNGGWAQEHWQGGITPGCLVDFAIKHPKSVPEPVKNALRRWAVYVNPLSSNPFGLTAWDRNHIFNTVVNPPWQCAENGRYITNSWALMLGAKWTGQGKLRTLALNNLNWVMGVNPAGICMIRDKGERPQEGWWGMVYPGSISNGMISMSQLRGLEPTIKSYSGPNQEQILSGPVKDDSPGLVNGNQFSNIYVTSEPWTPYNGWMLIALAEMVSGK